jgi:hypothetical protein
VREAFNAASLLRRLEEIMKWRGCLLLTLAFGCGDSAKALYRIDPVPPGADCAYGGNLVRYGVDRNHNGVLDAGEVTESHFLCNPTPPALAPLVERTDAVAPSLSCPAGGARISVGYDQNGNGKLDDSEIVKSTDVCSQPPPPVLVRTRSEPASATCANGGTIVESGPDANGDGKLEDNEVAKTTRVCNPPDKTALVRLDPEPSGPSCSAGGTAVKSGLDLDGDGKLEDNEVTSTKYACNPPPVIETLHGNQTIATQSDLDAFKGVHRVVGTVTISSPTLTKINLPDLEVIDFALIIQNNVQLDSVSLSFLSNVQAITIDGNPLLTSAELGFSGFDDVAATGSVTVSYNPLLKTIDIQLGSIGGNLTIENNAAIFDITNLNQVYYVPGTVLIKGNAALIEPALPNVLEIGGDLIIENNDSLTHLMGLTDWQLKSIGGGLAVRGNAKLTDLRGIMRLRDIAGDVEISTPAVGSPMGLEGLTHIGGRLEIHDNNVLSDFGGLSWNLTSIDGDLLVLNNATLVAFDLTKLASIGGQMRVELNPQLPECAVDRFAKKLSPTILTTSGNDTTATCP